VDITRSENLIATRRTATTLSIRRKNDKPILHYAVTALDRYGNESQPIHSSDNTTTPIAFTDTDLLPNDGKMLTVPLRNIFDSDLLVVCDLKGRKLRNYTNRQQINISQLPEGMYLLKSMDKKRRMHRLGIFSIKR
jgi:hypothetical protein